MDKKKIKKMIAARAARGLESPNLEKKLQELKGGKQEVAPVASTQPVQDSNIPTGFNPETQSNINQNFQNTQQGFVDNTGFSNKYMGNLFNQLQNQGQFNPQGLPDLNRDYTQDRQKATDSVMSEFNRLNKDRFAYEDAMFEQRMAEQGIDPASEKYQTLKKQNDLSRGSQIQQAQNNAYQVGQSEQAQGFGQALAGGNQMFNQQLSQYQMPLAQMNTMMPFYNTQGNFMNNMYQNQFVGNQNQMNRDFTAGENQLNRQNQFDLNKQQFGYNMKLQQSAPRGGGGGGQPPVWAQMGFASPLDYQQHEMNLAMIQSGQMGGNPAPRNNIGNSFVNGITQGAGNAIGNTLIR